MIILYIDSKITVLLLLRKYQAKMWSPTVGTLSPQSKYLSWKSLVYSLSSSPANDSLRFRTSEMASKEQLSTKMRTSGWSWSSFRSQTILSLHKILTMAQALTLTATTQIEICSTSGQAGNSMLHGRLPIKNLHIFLKSAGKTFLLTTSPWNLLQGSN